MDRIDSKGHFVVSVLVGAAVAAGAGASVERGALLVAYASLVGVLIDFDHFLIARLRTGDWRALRYLAARPSAAFLHQDDIFEPGEVGKIDRLLSHALIGGGLVGGLAVVGSPVTFLTAAVMYAHVVGDLIWDVRDLRGRGVRM